MSWRYRHAVVVASALLAACATPPARPPAPVAPSPSSVIADIPATAAPIAAPVVATTDVWTRLRESFAMDDCDSDPAVIAAARRYTAHPRSFETHLTAVLPTLDYVQRITAQHGVPGEFVLLPWVESHYRMVAPRRHRAAGMWQIMAITARSMDLPVDSDYDARLDRTVASDAVMRLLSGYHDRFKDWRVADMAYNTGEYRVRKLVRKHGLPPARPVIPAWPVGRITRNHLAKLLAIACVVREPRRFHVQLPTLEPGRRLQAITLQAPLTLHRASRLAGLPLAEMRELNAGYRSGRMPKDGPWRLLLPADSATRLLAAMAGEDATELAGLDPADDALPSLDDDREADDPATYTVVRGDTLWGIARNHDVGVGQLRAWNNLRTPHTLRPGQVLKVSDP
jgi:membrane-bound lytic murein transglycosylase D